MANPVALVKSVRLASDDASEEDCRHQLKHTRINALFCRKKTYIQVYSKPLSVLKSWGRVEEAKLRAGVGVCELIQFHAKHASKVQNQGL